MDADVLNGGNASATPGTRQAREQGRPQKAPQWWTTNRVHYAARNEYKTVLAIMPFPASPMDT
jgi:hypothetical protein